MDSKITMAFDSEVIAKAKAFAQQQNIHWAKLSEAAKVEDETAFQINLFHRLK